MKTKLFLTLCLCSLSINVWADPDIIKWKNVRTVWSMYREYSLVDGQREHRSDQYLFGKDTTIGSNAYWEVFWREEGDYTKQVSAGYALREDSVRVYVYDYASQKECVLYDFFLKENDILAVDWIEETETRKNPVFRVLAVGDTTWQKLHYLKVYDTVHEVMDMWLSCVGSLSHGIVWHRDFGASLDTFETLLCVDGGVVYKNLEYTSCYIPKAEPEYVSCTGKLILVPEPLLTSVIPDCYCTTIAIRWGELTPILSFNSRWAPWQYPLDVQGVEYWEGDSVDVEGYVSIRRDADGYSYSQLEIENIQKINTTSVSVEKQPKAELKLIPNPANETITLIASGCNLQRVEILDANGRILFASALNGTDSFRYNVSWMPSGIYFARITTSCGGFTEKFSVE